MKTIAGETILALLKSSLTAFSDSPTYLFRSSGPFTEMKLTPLSLATAFAKSVLPVPGFPFNNTPLVGLTPIRLNALGCFIGHSTVSMSSCLTSSKPPISVHCTLGFSTRTSLIKEG